MAFGRNRTSAESFEPLHWEQITRFTVGRELRDALRRSRRGEGPYAIRFGRTRGTDEYMVPGVHIRPAATDAPAGQAGLRLYEDEAGQRLLCEALPEPAAPDGPGSPGGFRVTDPAGRELGSVHRTPPARRLVQHSWWIRRPGHADLVARYHWAKGSPLEIVGRGAGKALGSVVDSVLSMGAEGGDNPPPKPAAWRTSETAPPALTAGPRWYTLHGGDLDPRLAFTLAVLRTP